MAKISFNITSLADLQLFGRVLGKNVTPGQMICLDGDLGAGKTTCAQAIASGLEVPADCYVTSPSFAIMHEYTGGRLPMYHMDFYRLTDSTEVIDLGFEEYFYGEGVTIVEWAKVAIDIIPEDSLRINFSIKSENTRSLEVFYTLSFEGIVAALKQTGLHYEES